MLNKINSNIFIKSTLVLLIGGIVGKLVGFILKIIITRYLKTEGMGILSLLSPTSSLLTVIATFSYPTAISKVISDGSSKSKNVILSLLPLSIAFGLLIVLITIFISPYLSNFIIKDNDLIYPLICLSITVPFISVSSIIKGYFWGRQNMFPYMLSNFIEQVFRLLVITLFIKYFLSLGITYAICFIILVNAIGEIISQIVMVLYFPKNSINLKDFSFNKTDIMNVMNISVPATSSKIIGSIAYFLEPIIITNMLLLMGYTKNYIIYEYGIINAYALSLLLMPQFLTQNMSSSLVPELSKYYSQNDNKMCIKRIKQIVLISSSIGLLSTLVITIFPSFFLNILYHTNEGIDYIRLLSPFTILFYVEYPLTNALQALGKSSKAMKCTIISSIIRLLSIIFFSLLKIGMYSLVISIIINLITSTYLNYREIRKALI